MAKTTDEKLADIRRKRQQLKNQEQALIAREKEKERKKRLSHYIKMGEVMDRHFDTLSLSLDQLEQILTNIDLNQNLKDALVPPQFF